MDYKERDPKLEKHFDEWLDDALAGYSKADPRPGLEQRITATLRAEDRAPARRRWWMFLTPAAAALAVLAVTISLHQKQGTAPAQQNVATSPEIARNEPTSRYIMPENDRAKTSAHADEVVKPPRETASASNEKKEELRYAPRAARIYSAPPPPVAVAQQPARDALTPPKKSIHVGPVAPMVAAAKPAPPQPFAASSGVVGMIRNDAPQASGAAAAPAPPPPAEIAKSNAEPREAGRYYEAAPQIAATMTRPAATFKKQATEQTVEVAGAAPVLDASALETSNTLVAPDAKKLDKAKVNNESVFYKLDFVLRELEDGKLVNTRNYSLMARSGDWQQLRVGTSAPTTTERKQLDNAEAIGLSVDCRILPGTDGNAVLVTKADITSIANYAPQYSANATPPVHRVQMNTSAPVTLGKPTVLSGVDELNSKHRFELEVTVTKAK